MIRKSQLPRLPAGPVTGEALNIHLETIFRAIVSRMDIRDPRSDFPGAILASNDGTVTIGTASSVTSQRTLPMVNAGGRLSAQSVTPLTSTGSPSTAQIQITSHTLQFGFGQVTYGAGSIAGLLPSTEYHVYADDDYQGGAAAYTATTNKQTVVAGRNRYHVGTIITANTSASGTVLTATSASPIVIGVTAHGFLTSDVVAFAGMPGDFAVLNSGTHTVTRLTADTFSVPIDGTTFVAYAGGGSVTRISVATDGRFGGGWDYNTGYAHP